MTGFCVYLLVSLSLCLLKMIPYLSIRRDSSCTNLILYNVVVHCSTGLKHERERYVMTTITDYDQALALIRQFDRRTQARLIAQVAQELTASPLPPLPKSIDPRVTLAELRAHFAELGPVAPSASEQLERDRQSRARFLEDEHRDIDVHP